MNALELLKVDHKRVADLFEKAESVKGDKEKERLFEQIKADLEVHTYIEESIFYPALEEHEELNEITLEAYEEHMQVKTLLREIPKLVEGSDKFDAKFKVLKDNIEHHVEEEEQEMFPQVRQLFNSDELIQLGEEMEAARQKYGKKHRSSSSSSRK